MPDQFTESVTTGYGSRIVDSIKGVIFGFILFIASFGLLYWNEGRVDLSTIAKTAITIPSATVSTDVNMQGKLVSTTGVVKSNEMIGDGLYVKPDAFIAVERTTEMYAWVEKEESKTTKNIGGSETKETTYTYTKEWTENPKAASDFKHPEGHENPTKLVESSVNKVTAATIGAYGIDMTSVELPSYEALPLSEENTEPDSMISLANKDYLFINQGETTSTYQAPSLGDVRISYHVLKSGFTGTLFGALNGEKIDSYTDQAGNSLYRVFAGTREQGISTLHAEYTMMLWILRVLGFFLMWGGLAALFGPISVLLDILPIFGAISRSVIGLVAGAVSLVLTIVTILVSMIAHSMIAVVVALALAIAGMIAFVVHLKRARAASMATTSAAPKA